MADREREKVVSTDEKVGRQDTAYYIGSQSISSGKPRSLDQRDNESLQIQLRACNRC